VGWYYMAMDEKGLGKRLQEVRREKGFTQQRLCQKANLSYSTLAKIERGAIKSPSIFTIQSIATVLGVSLDELLGVAPPQSRQLRHTKSGVGFVYFDINGCLVYGYQRAFTALAKAAGVLPDIVETTFWKYNDDVNKGTMSLSDFNQAMSSRLGASIDWGEAYLTAVEPIKPMQELLERASQQYKVGLFTNSMPGIVSILKQRGLLPSLPYDAIIDSSEIGVTKPNAEAYAIAAQRAGCEPGEILLIDDLRGNLGPAEQAGWHVLQYDGSLPQDSLERVRSALELDPAED
jgi:putative hydrolase of the HAD superfamily